MDAPPDDQPELAPPAVVHPKRPLDRTTTRTRLAVAHPFSCLHPPGVGLDFLFEVHDRRNTLFRWGACRDRQVHTPPPLSFPTGTLRSDRGASQAGGGVLFSHSWGGVAGRGLPRRRAWRLTHFKPRTRSPSRRIRDLAPSPAVFTSCSAACRSATPARSSPFGSGVNRFSGNSAENAPSRAATASTLASSNKRCPSGPKSDPNTATRRR